METKELSPLSQVKRLVSNIGYLVHDAGYQLSIFKENRDVTKQELRDILPAKLYKQLAISGGMSRYAYIKVEEKRHE